jgi:hypothetical protein
MNKTLLVLAIVLKSLFVFSQEITLTGKVYHYAVGIKEERKIYFTFDETPFSEQHFLKYTENYEYEWKISINRLKKDSIKSVYFSIDAKTNHLERDNCVQEIRLDSLLANDTYLKKKNSSIDCDLILDYTCPIFVNHHPPFCDGPFCHQFLGDYLLEIESLPYEVKISEDQLNNNLIIKGIEKGIYSDNMGIWKYDSTSQMLSFNFYIKLNAALGLMKMIEPKTFAFKVTEVDGVLQFESDEFELKKIN